MGLFLLGKMVLFRCQNKKRTPNGVVKCNRILAILTDSQVQMIKNDPEGGPIHLCPHCPSDSRWSQVSWSGTGFVFKIIDKPDITAMNSGGDNLNYSDRFISEEV
jgi:hypothetical protein